MRHLCHHSIKVIFLLSSETRTYTWGEKLCINKPGRGNFELSKTNSKVIPCIKIIQNIINATEERFLHNSQLLAHSIVNICLVSKCLCSLIWTCALLILHQMLENQFFTQNASAILLWISPNVDRLWKLFRTWKNSKPLLHHFTFHKVLGSCLTETLMTATTTKHCFWAVIFNLGFWKK